ncbi:glycogen synthase [Flavobacterium sp.]|uniref:glycogen synthase n=1 Tax=Flavobacterium sp. TaxID=239 RepID=UPI0038FC4C0D
MEIFHIAAECYPVAKVGGLADVVGALPKYLRKSDHDVKVVIPYYKSISIKEKELKILYSNNVKLGSFNFPFNIHKEIYNVNGFELYLVEIPELFDRKDIYGYEDDIERFLAFQIAALDWLITRNTVPDIIHCHDHHTGLIPFMMIYSNKYQNFRNVSSVITIHNSIYQGEFSFDKLHYLPEFDLTKVVELEWNNRINSLATGINSAKRVTTVSPTYLDEITYSAFGLELLFQKVKFKSEGILNGIDKVVWEPLTDKFIEVNYSVNNFKKGKQYNKEKLCSQFNLDPKKPLFSFIGRLLDEKGADLLPPSAAMALSENYKEINILILGSGNVEIEKQLNHLKTSFIGNYNVVIGYNEELAHLIYGGSDFLLMPSRVEPCGLNQMYALAYGTIPIVRRTGGLKDTVIDLGDDGNGICHDQASIVDICYSIRRAVDLFKDKKKLNQIIKKGMNIDHSWENVCKEYIGVYNLIINKNES